MKILVTGANGFVGKNLVEQLQNCGYTQVYTYDIDTPQQMLDVYAKDCAFVFHLAGVNRPEKQSEFMEGNFGFTSLLLDKLAQYANKAPVLITSSIQATLDNPYGKSKKAGEDLIRAYGQKNDVATYIYRLPNVFGKWCRPNYNSAVATFCYNIAHDLPIVVNDPEVVMNLVYVDDVVRGFIQIMERFFKEGYMGGQAFETIEPVYTRRLGEITQLLYSFRQSRETLLVPNMQDAFTKKLYSTYLSYLPRDGFSYPLNMHVDERGSFTEILKSPERGQVSVNIAKPGIVKGNHWHHTKNEKFVVVSGEGVIRFRKIGEQQVIEYYVSGERLQVVDIPTGYTHNIENLGDTDMITLMWANELFDPDAPDTYFLEV